MSFKGGRRAVFNKILVPLDGSRLAEAVLPYAVELATSFRGRILILQVVPPTSQVVGLTGATDLGPIVTTDFDAISATLEAELQKAESYLKTVGAKLEGQGVQVERKVRQGPAGPAIVQCAREEKVDIIALSTHGRSGLGRLVFGSIADHVLRRSGLPILLIKPDTKGEAEG